jgi:hypothetical protein
MTNRLKLLMTPAVAAVFLTVALARGQVPKDAPREGSATIEFGKAFAKRVEKAGAPKEAPKDAALELRNRLEAVFKKAALAARVAPAMPAGAVFQVQVQNINMFAQQLEPQFRALLRVEYQFMRTVCAPTKDQRLPIVRRSDTWVKEAAKQYADWQMNGRRLGGRPPTAPDVRSLLVEEVSKAVKEHLKPEQFQRYKKELDARVADEKQVGILNLLAKLDQSLVLNADQRDKIAASLTAGWDEAWSQHLQMFQLADQYVPSIPDERVVPFLNPLQKELWSGFQKIGSVNFGFNVGMNDQAGPLDEDWPDEPKARP